MWICSKISFYAIAVILSLSSVSVAQWEETNGPYGGGTVYCFAVQGDEIFAGTDGGVFVSGDYGSTWARENKGLTDSTVRALVFSGTNLFAGTLGGVFLSTDNGAAWAPSGLLDLPLRGLTVTSDGAGGTAILASTNGNGIFRSANGGVSWSAASSGLTSSRIWAIAAIGTQLFAATGSGVCRSTDNGASWTSASTGLTDPTWGVPYVYSIVADGSRLIAGTGGDGIFVSTDNGGIWNGSTISAQQYGYIYSLFFSGTNIFAGGNSGDGLIFLSTDGGWNWTRADSGLINSPVRALAVCGSYLFAGTEVNGVWRRPLSQMVTSIRDAGPAKPVDFFLAQNYPNPFNPTTVIRYEIPLRASVTLKVYDALGRLVEILVEERQTPGSYSVVLDGGGLMSGVYFYRLQAGPFSATRKLLLLR